MTGKIFEKYAFDPYISTSFPYPGASGNIEH